MHEKDLPAVIAIHNERFAASRTGMMGGRFLRKLYQWFLIHNPELSLVAVDDDDHVVGFYVASKGRYTTSVFRHTFSAIVWRFLANPVLLLRKNMFEDGASFLRSLVFQRRKEPEEKGLQAGDEDRTIYCASFAVAKAHEGIGVPLIFAIEAEAKKNFDRHILSAWVEKRNERLIKIYQALGWKPVHESSHLVRLVKRTR